MNTERILRTATRHFIGLDLGQKRDYTAIAIIEEATHTLADPDPVTYERPTRKALSLRHAERIPLGTPYPDVVLRVSTVVGQACFDKPVTLVVDATGLGAPVVDHLRRSRLNCKLDPVVITAQVRRDLLSNLLLLFEEETLKFAHDLRLLDAVVDELNGLSLDYESEQHDDLAFAVALAAWPLRRRSPGGHQPNPLPIYFQKPPGRCA